MYFFFICFKDHKFIYTKIRHFHLNKLSIFVNQISRIFLIKILYFILPDIACLNLATTTPHWYSFFSNLTYLPIRLLWSTDGKIWKIELWKSLVYIIFASTLDAFVAKYIFGKKPVIFISEYNWPVFVYEVIFFNLT